MESENRVGVVGVVYQKKANQKRDILVFDLSMVYDDVTGQS